MSKLTVYKWMRHRTTEMIVLVALLAVLVMARPVNAGAALALPALTAPTASASLPDAMNFRVWLDDRAIGEHAFRFQDGERLTVTSEVSLQVKVLFVKVFDYEHATRELWDGACLAEFTSRTRSNGRTMQVGAQREGNAFNIEIARGRSEPERVTADDACVGNYAYWDLERLHKHRLMNGQTGDVNAVTLEYVGPAPVPRTDRVGRQYSLVAEQGRIDLWYDSDGLWLGLATDMDGRRLAYVNETVL